MERGYKRSPVSNVDAAKRARQSLSWENFPTELLELILSFIPLRQRLLITSLVCSRWLRVARRCPASLAAVTVRALTAAASILSCITEIGEFGQCRPQDVALLTCLTSLRLTGFPCARDCQPDNTRLQCLRPVTSLYFHPTICFGCTQAAFTSLTALHSLTVRVGRERLPVDCSMLQLPFLRVLDLGMPGLRTSYAPRGPKTVSLRSDLGCLIARYATQLTSLCIALEPHELTDLCTESFPQLRHCDLLIQKIDILSATVQAFMATAPRLASLALRMRWVGSTECVEDIIRVTSRVLTALHIEMGADMSESAVLAQLLADCTHAPIEFSTQDRLATLPIAAHGHLTSLEYPVDASVLPLMLQLRSFTHVVAFDSPEFSGLINVNVRTVLMELGLELPLVSAFPHMHAYVRCFPNLQAVIVRGDAETHYNLEAGAPVWQQEDLYGEVHALLDVFLDAAAKFNVTQVRFRLAGLRTPVRHQRHYPWISVLSLNE